MKGKFTTIDICAVITEIKQQLLGLRVVNVYDIDSKSYLIKLAKPDYKNLLLIESGTRFHTTDFEWPKHIIPSGFSMKLRKHLRTRRLVEINQLGIDRIVDFQFGSNEAAYHLIVEFYDRGNIVLTDYQYTILSLLRTRTDKENQDVRFAVREQYPCHLAKQPQPSLTTDELKELLSNAKKGDPIRKVLNPRLIYGPALIEHCLIGAGFKKGAKIDSNFSIDRDLPQILAALNEAEKYMSSTSETCQGYITQSKTNIVKDQASDSKSELLAYVEFHPFLFRQYENDPYISFPSFNKAVDNFFSQLESQKLNVKALQQENAALKKLTNVKKDHAKRIENLKRTQDENTYKAQLIELNLELVDKAITVICSAVANQMDWSEIKEILKEAQSRDDPVACCIKRLKLETNQITILLQDPYMEDSAEENEDEEEERSESILVDIDLNLSAYANAKSYFDQRRYAAKKEQKTIMASKSALKSAEAKTKRALKDVAIVASINKIRKTYWFEKFLWFISSENYLIIGGRDQQQNELIVKRHLQPGDLYVHADLHGASSLIIKNPTGKPVPPVTLNEAGCMAICFSAAWNAKVITSAWWVHHNQVSKTAPTGEYLQTGSFMIRGKKNYLPPSQLILGFGFLFKLDEVSIANHVNDRKPREIEDSNVTEEDSIENMSEEIEKTLDLSATHSGESDSNSDQAENEADFETSNIDNEMSHPHAINQNDEQQNIDSTLEMFPDTNVNLQYVDGDRYELHSEQLSLGEKDMKEDENIIFLGDDEPVDLTNTNVTSKDRDRPRISAKERRQLRRQNLQTKSESVGDSTEETNSKENSTKQLETNSTNPQKNSKQQQIANAPKRGQRGKLKKIKQKYADQDEEERALKMEILASSKKPSENKKKKDKKDKKNLQGNKKGLNPKVAFLNASQDSILHSDKTKINNDGNKLTRSTDNGMIGNQEVIDETAAASATAQLSKEATIPQEKNEKEIEDLSDDEEKAALLAEENIRLSEESDKTMSYLNTLTGCPIQEDILLFAVPVCAPYGALQNYKFKAKIIPGSTRKGKAIKAAIHLFVNSKDSVQREKDLIKIVKDNDMARYVPNNVKISAPNLKKKR
ncbi:Nuclear export mediator factor NEMF-like protein [Trichoplax sp. H2]|nr:Nuclear export mediator factor NEMF-like protein [Trichoplax sp. H2]|eukprot:RDD37814.1 Nuclear export mediator factor NEMF-like protein [Trichoplax sp. H2]